MKRLIAEWVWRAALIGALGWIGLEVHSLHADLLQPADEQVTAYTGPDDAPTSIDDLRDDLAGLRQKVDAILVVMASNH